jgi:hypothetical protein
MSGIYFWGIFPEYISGIYVWGIFTGCNLVVICLYNSQTDIMHELLGLGATIKDLLAGKKLRSFEWVHTL